jgi:hypothetical protein
MMKSILAPFATGESKSRETLPDPNSKICRDGKMRFPTYHSNLMRKKFWPRSSTMPRNSVRMLLPSAIPSWQRRKRSKLSAFTCGRLRVPKFSCPMKPISSDKLSMHIHQSHQLRLRFWNPPNPPGNLVPLNSRNLWPSMVSTTLKTFPRICGPSLILSRGSLASRPRHVHNHCNLLQREDLTRALQHRTRSLQIRLCILMVRHCQVCRRLTITPTHRILVAFLGLPSHTSL